MFSTVFSAVLFRQQAFILRNAFNEHIGKFSRVVRSVSGLTLPTLSLPLLYLAYTFAFSSDPSSFPSHLHSTFVYS